MVNGYEEKGGEDSECDKWLNLSYNILITDTIVRVT